MQRRVKSRTGKSISLDRSRAEVAMVSMARRRLRKRMKSMPSWESTRAKSLVKRLRIWPVGMVSSQRNCVRMMRAVKVLKRALEARRER